jgi:hypothetical protein
MRPIPDCCGPVSGTLRTDVGQSETPGLPQGTESRDRNQSIKPASKKLPFIKKYYISMVCELIFDSLFILSGIN